MHRLQDGGRAAGKASPARLVVAYAEVAVARPLADVLTYRVPEALSGSLRVGHTALVPLGAGAETGYVVGLRADTDVDSSRIKPLSRVLDPVPAFDERQLAFFRWVARYYLAPLGMVIHTALPSQIRARVLRVAHATEAGADAIATGEAKSQLAHVLREVIARPDRTRRGLCRSLAPEMPREEVESALATLERRGWLAWGKRELEETAARVRTVRLARPAAEVLAQLPASARRMRALVDALATAGGPVDVPSLLDAQGSAAMDSLKKLVDRGAVAFGERERRDVLVDAQPSNVRPPPTLNADQAEAVRALSAGGSGVFVLFGVTGSGKTEVFLGAAEAALARGAQVLVLVPEIGLTPQLVGRFRARFGADTVAVLHSGLTGTERLGQWRRIRAREARVVVGARSALFAPFERLGLVVVDEEHDDSYKQDDGVPYHARDLAVVLARDWECPCVLASATPSMESWVNAREGKYTLIRLPRRATPRPVPLVEQVDLTALPEPRPILAPVVEQALRDTFAAGAQAIVLYNRRGFATLVACTECGGAYECPNCGVTMTLHRRASTLACHYCGLHRPYTGSCPACGSQKLEELGKGTERIEEELKTLFPSVAQARMDADTTAVRGAHARILDAFCRGETQLLVGTQIVAKGHDFPGVRTAVVVSADHGLRIPDFRSAERTAALLVQLTGRAGRGSEPGRVFVQTWNPRHYALKYLDRFEDFLEHELRIRTTLQVPPATRLVLVRLESAQKEKAERVAAQLARTLGALATDEVRLLGPALAALPRVGGRWRYQLVARSRNVRSLRSFLDRALEPLRAASGGGVRVRWDVDPRHLL